MSRIANLNKKRLLRELANSWRPESKQIKTIRGFNKMFDVNTEQSYIILDELLGTTDFEVGQNNMAKVVDLYYASKGTTRTFLYLLNDDTRAEIVNRTVDIPQFETRQAFDNWFFSGEIWFWRKDSDQDIFDEYGNEGRVYSYKPNTVVNRERIIQSFREGEENCVLKPVRKWAQMRIDSGSRPKEYMAVLNKIKKLEVKYKGGVPETDIAQVADQLKVKFEISYPFSKVSKTYGDSNKYTFKLMNTGYDHVEHVKNNQIHTCYVTRDELEYIMDELEEQKQFYYYTKNLGRIGSVSTLDQSWSILTEFKQVTNELMTTFNLHDYRICDIQNADLSKFVLRGTHYNTNMAFPNAISNHKGANPEIFKCIDQKKAYYNFKKCKFYEGFMGKITDFRETDAIQGVGLYHVAKFNFEKFCEKKKYPSWVLHAPPSISSVHKFKKLNDMMKMYIDNNVYTSAELRFLSSLNITYTITGGCWGVEPFDFDFGEDMLKKANKQPYVDEDGEFSWKGSSFYALLTGMWDYHNTHSYTFMRGTAEYADVLRQNTENSIVYFKENDNEICIKQEKTSSKHLGHITAFILAYQRLSMIEQLIEMDLDKIQHIYVDGIYYKDHEYTLLDTFVAKDIESYGNLSFTDTGFLTNIGDDSCDFIGSRTHYKREIFLGAGGCGKTHLNLVDKGLTNVIYSAKTHKLNAVKRAEYGVNTYTWAALIDGNPEKEQEIRRTGNVLVIDEVSMMSDQDKDKLFKKYSNMKIIMCGDVGYQLPCFELGEIPLRISGFDGITTLVNNRRAKCEKLKTLLLQLRDDIRNHQEECDLSTCNSGTVDTYTVQDVIIVGTNTIKEKYTDKFKHLNKWFIVKKTAEHYNGDIVISDIQPLQSVRRHAFTAYSIQGETCKNKIYIDVKSFGKFKRGIQGLYTAISRAEYLDQIILI